MLMAAILVGGFIGWWASRNSARPGTPVPEMVSHQTASPERTPVPLTKDITTEIPVPIPVAASTNSTDEAETWEDKLDEILTSELDTTQMGESLLDLMPTVNEEAQMELAGHIVNLVDDEHYARVAPYLTNAAVPEAVSSVFMNDLYNRANSLKLPLVLAVARTENHPLREEAKDLLELYIEEDYGTDWKKWESAMNTWLKENPDEEDK